MITKSRSALVNDISETLASVKAQRLPAVCEKLGLAPGTESEAFSSKRSYVRRRIDVMTTEELIGLGRRTLELVDSAALREALALAKPPDQCVSALTRQHIIGELSSTENLFGKLGAIEVLHRLWPIDSMPSEDLRFANFKDELVHHTYVNDDWSVEYLLARLDLMNASEERFRAFLEEVCHPLVRLPGEQESLVKRLNSHLARDGFELAATEQMSGFPVFRLIRRTFSKLGPIKNLIFASVGPKPEIVLDDATTNEIRIVKYGDLCLVYDSPIGASGLLWSDLVEWWNQLHPAADLVGAARTLYQRLQSSLASEPERILFRSYFATQKERLGDELPALIPQVYLHYDPYTATQRRGQIVVVRQRMDFLMVLPNRRRIVIEVDGAQHYSFNDKPDPARYAQMVAEDRRIKLNGYDVFRFGGAELSSSEAERTVKTFFDELLRDYEV